MPTKKLNRTQEIIEKVFRDSELAFGLKEFENIDFEKALEITEEEKNRFYVKDLKSGKMKFVFDETKQSGKPEEIIRQLWLYKLNTHYKYPLERMDTEKSVRFGREIHAKAADIVVYKKDKITPYIIVEVKSPTEKKGIDQLKTYLNAEGAEIGFWSNGINHIILYRPYPKEFDDTLPDLPSADQTIDDLLEAKKTYYEYTTTKESLKNIVESMEELVLANAGVDVFTEVFKLVYAKLYDEQEAKLNRADHEVFSENTVIRQRPIRSSTSFSREPSRNGLALFMSRKISISRRSIFQSSSASLNAPVFSALICPLLTRPLSI